MAQGFVCKVCRAGGRKAADEFHFEDVKIECVYEFAYLGNMLNDTGEVGVVQMKRAQRAWQNVVYARDFIEELGSILEKCFR